MSDDVDDVRRVLTMAFRGLERINRFDLERWLAFDMEWMPPHEAEQAVTALVQSSWLREIGPDLGLNMDLGMVEVPLGWFPRPNRLLSPVKAVSTAVEQGSANVPKKAPSPETDTLEGTTEHLNPTTENPSPSDPRAKLSARMKRFIARSSGIDPDELQRRADRKQKVFHHITPWLALALVAREQGLDMVEIVDALAVV